MIGGGALLMAANGAMIVNPGLIQINQVCQHVYHVVPTALLVRHQLNVPVTQATTGCMEKHRVWLAPQEQILVRVQHGVPENWATWIQMSG